MTDKINGSSDIANFPCETVYINKPPQQKLFQNKVRFEVFTAVTMKNSVFSVVTPCGSCKNRKIPWYFFAAYVGC
jgi:hypothetical protein